MAPPERVGGNDQPPAEITYGPLKVYAAYAAFGSVMILASLLVGLATIVFAGTEGAPPVGVGILIALLLLGLGTTFLVFFFRTTTSFSLTVDRGAGRLIVQRVRFGVRGESWSFDLGNVSGVSVFLGSKKLGWDSGNSKDRPAGTVNLVFVDGGAASITRDLVHGTDVHERTAARLREALGLADQR